eukprot:scaffold247893_cov20-Attheya_sp.AAC.1
MVEDCRTEDESFTASPSEASRPKIDDPVLKFVRCAGSRRRSRRHDGRSRATRGDGQDEDR